MIFTQHVNIAVDNRLKKGAAPVMLAAITSMQCSALESSAGSSQGCGSCSSLTLDQIRSMYDLGAYTRPRI